MAKRTPKTTASIPHSELGTVAFDRIHRSPLNPRTEFPAKGIEDLAATIEQEGLLEALTVRPAPDRTGHFEIAAGERRYRALESLAKKGRIPADWPVPVQVRELDDRELLTLALVENLLREDLHPLDEGLAYKRLIDQGFKTAEIARRVKRSQRHVQLRIQLTTLAPEVQRAFRAGEILLAQARVLATAPPERHLAAFEAVRNYPAVFEDPRSLITLLAEDSFPRERAAFPASRYRGPKITNPETGQVYYLDVAKAMSLQAEAAEALREELLSEHPLQEVEILHGEPSRVWARYREAPAEPTHGAILISPTGEISVFERLKPVSESASETAPDEPARAHEEHAPSLQAAAQRIRNSALQEALAKQPATALRLVVVALLQRPGSTDTGLAFGPFRPGPPVEPRAGFAQGLASRLDEVLGPGALPPASDPLERISTPEEALDLLEVLEELSQNKIRTLLAALVASRVGSPAIPDDDATLVGGIARKLSVSVDRSLWLCPEYLGLYSRSALIRLAVDSQAVSPKEARELQELPRAEIIGRILESDALDPDYLPPELAFDVP